MSNKAAHLAVGIDVDGRKEVLGIWLEAVEGAKFWLREGMQDVDRGRRMVAQRAAPGAHLPRPIRG